MDRSIVSARYFHPSSARIRLLQGVLFLVAGLVFMATGSAQAQDPGQNTLTIAEDGKAYPLS